MSGSRRPSPRGPGSASPAPAPHERSPALGGAPPPSPGSACAFRSREGRGRHRSREAGPPGSWRAPETPGTRAPRGGSALRGRGHCLVCSFGSPWGPEGKGHSTCSTRKIPRGMLYDKAADVGDIDEGDWTPVEVEATVRRLDAARLQEPLRTLPLRPPVKVPAGTTLGEAIRRMRAARVGACLVEDASSVLQGIFTERDLLNRVPLDGIRLEDAPIERYMQPNP